ncbi:MAG: hypothetical protein ACKVYV_14805 [Limisphaerales bacterium]
MKRWQVIAAAVLLFACGLGTGLFLARGATQPRLRPDLAGGRPDAQFARLMEARLFAIRRLERELDLTTEQREKIEALVKETQARTRQAWQDMQPRLREEFRTLREGIRGVLTPEQEKEFERLMRRPRSGAGGEILGRTNRPPD